MTERGVAVDHSTIYRWVQRFAPEMEKRLRRQWRRPQSRSWRVDETYIKVRGKWAYLYRAVDKLGNTIDFYLSATRNTKAAKRFLGKALRGLKEWEQPEVLNTDKAPAYAAAIAELKAEGKCPKDTRHRQVKYLNNVVEADHGKLKLLIRPVRGFKTMKTAYAKGISTGDFAEALAALLGPDAGGLSASTVARLTEVWADEHAHWLKRDLSARHYVYFWADGIHVQARLEDDAQCLLVIIGATPEGKKELVGLIDGVRESAQSWRELLLDLKRRGLAVAPELAIADGALGFWKAIEEVWPRTRSQRCWVHKTANVLNKLPKSQHSKAKRALQEIWMAETRNDADSAFDAFIETYAVKYDKAAACLVKDRATMLAFHDFPAEHWKHLRTTNPIESTFATVRHRTVRSKGCLSNKTALAMVFKLAQAAQNSWRRLDGHNQLPKLIVGVKFIDGIEAVRQQPQAAA